MGLLLGVMGIMMQCIGTGNSVFPAWKEKLFFDSFFEAVLWTAARELECRRWSASSSWCSPMHPQVALGLYKWKLSKILLTSQISDSKMSAGVQIIAMFHADVLECLLSKPDDLYGH